MDVLIAFVSFGAWFASVMCGAAIGQHRGDVLKGLILGGIFGPIGVIAALSIDGREKCPRCAGKLDGRGEVCQHCGQPLIWRLQNGLFGPAKAAVQHPANAPARPGGPAQQPRPEARPAEPLAAHAVPPAQLR